MPKLITDPSRVEAAGNVPKVIEELVGRVNMGTEHISIVHA